MRWSEMTVCLQPQSLQEIVKDALVAHVCQRVQHFLAAVSQNNSYVLPRLFSKWTKPPPSSLQPLHDYLYGSLPPTLCGYICEEVLIAFQKITREEADAGGTKGAQNEKRWRLLNDVLEALLHPQLWSLNLSPWPAALAPTFYKNMHKLTGLKKLGLEGASRPDSWLPSCLPHLKNLVSIDLRDGGSDMLVSALAENCPNLAELYLAWAEAVTDRSIPSLLQMQSLRVLDIAETGITVNGVTDIVSGLVPLREIVVGVDLPLEPIILSLHKPRLSLQHLKLVETRQLDEALQKTPDLTCLELVAPICDLYPAAKLRHLIDFRLDISALPQQMNDAVDLLRMIGPERLLHLTLSNSDDVDLPTVISSCPLLKTLRLFHCTFTVPEYNQVRRPPAAKLSNLEEFTLSTLQQVQVWYVLEYLLPAARDNLRRLTIDTLMFPCIGSHRLANLLLSAQIPRIESLTLRGKILLTISTFHHFVNINPSLRVLGRAEFWERVTNEDLRFLREDLCSMNRRLIIE